MRYEGLGSYSEYTKTVMDVVGETLRDNQQAYPRFKVDNMAFVEIITPPPPNFMDVNGTREYIVVLLDDEPKRVLVPNKELFVRFMSVVRPDPDVMTESQRTRAALILATGADPDNMMGEEQPTWTDEEGILTISYLKLVGNGMAMPSKYSCTLTVDENQDFTVEES